MINTFIERTKDERTLSLWGRGEVGAEFQQSRLKREKFRWIKQSGQGRKLRLCVDKASAVPCSDILCTWWGKKTIPVLLK